MTAPFVGLPANSTSGSCAFAPDIDQPGCADPATVHLRAQDKAWGMVALMACDAHRSIAEKAAQVLERHPFGPGCGAPGVRFLPTHCEPEQPGGGL